MRGDIIYKLNMVRTSAKFRSILNYLLNDKNYSVNPKIASLYTTSDNYLLADLIDDNGGIETGSFMGTYNDLLKNIKGIGESAGLNQIEQQYLYNLVDLRVRQWRIIQ